jgi:hypothetical protein
MKQRLLEVARYLRGDRLLLGLIAAVVVVGGAALYAVTWGGVGTGESSPVVPLSSGKVSLALNPATVDLGELNAGEKRTVEVAVLNNSDQSVRMNRPTASCGCVAAQLSDSVLLPHDKVSLTFVVTAPSTPAELAKNVKLTSPDLPGRVWEVQIHGKVDPVVWSDPATVSGELDHDGVADFSVVVKFRKHRQPVRVTSKSNEIQITSVVSGPSEETVKGTIRSQAANRATLDVVRISQEKADGPLLQIPVAWHFRPEIRLQPSAVWVGDSKSSSISQKRLTIMAVTDPLLRGPRAIVVESLVPWAKVSSQRALNANTTELGIDVDTAAAREAAKQQGRLLSVRLRENDRGDQYVIWMRPP